MKRIAVLPFAIAVFGCTPEVLPESEGHAIQPGQALTASTITTATKTHTLRAIAGDEPGESELEFDGQPLAPHPGADDMPLLLKGERTVVFVSGRTGVASLWRVDVDGTNLTQLTNRTQRIGAIDDAFVPPPAWSLTQEGDAVVYDDGSGKMWRVDVKTGEVL